MKLNNWHKRALIMVFFNIFLKIIYHLYILVSTMKLRSGSILAFLFLYGTCCCVGFYTKFKKVKCLSSNLTLFPNYKCYIKAYNRQTALPNVFVKFTRPVTEVFANFSLQYRQPTNIFYRNIMNGNANVCDYLSNRNNHPLAAWIVKILRNSLPKSVIHPCPYKVRVHELCFYNFYSCFLFSKQDGLELYNISLHLKGFHFPNGFFRGNLSFFNFEDYNLLTLDFTVEMIGSKESDF
jgi:hypothetical protein